jgi:hypothetical protein
MAKEGTRVAASAGGLPNTLIPFLFQPDCHCRLDPQPMLPQPAPVVHAGWIPDQVRDDSTIEMETELERAAIALCVIVACADTLSGKSGQTATAQAPHAHTPRRHV